MKLEGSSGFGLLYKEPPFQDDGPRSEDDWSGTSNPALRRKIQNRLNQRAARQRKNQTTSRPSIVINGDNEPIIQRINNSQVPVLEHVAAVDTLSLTSGDMVYHPQSKSLALFNGTPNLPLIARSRPSAACITPLDRRSITSAANFTSWMISKTKKREDHVIFPFSADNLLTLQHFNLVRAITYNIIAIGIDPIIMCLDIPSPFFTSVQGPSISRAPPHLPWTLKPTELQQHIYHHPFVDVCPSSRIRDNLLLAENGYNKDELCADILGLTPLPESGTEDVANTQPHGPTGLRVWGEPWNPASWEVTEEFVKKWRWLLVGCTELLDSTNYWREMRGEEHLVWELE